MSIGGIIRGVECSICGLDPEDCEHITGRAYGDEVCHRIITDIDLQEISLVGRPEQPDARVTSVSIDSREIQAALGPAWHPGMPVSCDRCLNGCSGISDPFVDRET